MKTYHGHDESVQRRCLDGLTPPILPLTLPLLLPQVGLQFKLALFMVLNHFSCFFFSFVCRPPLCVRAGPRVHGHAARMCEDKSERAREREQLRDHLHVCVAALTFPPLFTPNHITIRSLTLGTNILADL